MVVLFADFARVFPEKRLELKSLKRQTKAEEEGPRGQNGGTEGAPWGNGPSLKYKFSVRPAFFFTYTGKYF
jgi:hypothetical protein